MNGELPDFEALERFVDARQESRERAEVVRRLASDPGARAHVAAARALNARLREHFDPVREEAIPASLTEAALGHRSRRPVRSWRWATMAASLLLATALGAAGGWWWHGVAKAASERGAFIRAALQAHQIYARAPEHAVEFPAEHAAELKRWMAHNLGSSATTPRLRALGFRLLGGRFLPTPDGTATQLIYEDRSGKRLALYLRADLANRDELQFQFGAPSRRIDVLYWLDGPRGYALTGALGRPRLRRVAELIYAQLES